MLPFPPAPSDNGGTLGELISWNNNLLKNCNAHTILIKECTKESENFTHKRALTTEQKKKKNRFQKTAPGVVSQTKAEWQLALDWGNVVFGKTKRYIGKLSQLNFFPPV